ncbi:MAG TPA: tRNA pseudouridine(38-40) synthase TruA [Candidatus Methylomirabilis sp.]
MRNLRMLVEYDGTNYHGWQTQLDQVTIQSTIEKSIERITQERMNLTGSGRTDAKVHAFGQVANFRSKTNIEAPLLKKALNSLLPEDVVIKKMEEAPLEFDSCIDALSKTYRYSILNRPEPCAIGRFYSSQVARPLDVEAMEEASAYLLGEHDFSSFRSSSCSARNPIRNVQQAEFRKEDDLIHFYIQGSGFLHHMVRCIVGTLMDVGRGKITSSDFRGILEAKDRRLAGRTARPQGLCLMEVRYP